MKRTAILKFAAHRCGAPRFGHSCSMVCTSPPKIAKTSHPTSSRIGIEAWRLCRLRFAGADELRWTLSPPPPSVSSECLKGSYITYVVGSDLCQETTLVNVTPGGHIFCIASWRSKLLYLHISIIRETFPKGTVVTSLLGRGDEITPPPDLWGLSLYE